MKQRLTPESEITLNTSFTRQWIFLRSETKDRLMATGNGVTAQIFDGCRFKANANQLIFVSISGGKIIHSTYNLMAAAYGKLE